MTIRLEPKVRKDQILEAALSEAADKGYLHITRDSVAKAANCSPASVSNYFGTMTQMKRSVMRAAVHQRVLSIIAQGIIARDPQALCAPDDVRTAALKQFQK